ncbi:MAG TPA: excisionase family DNA-binding protein [Holophaga sp.]|nr:excisionase family DNA-binding protein [Holophaga sp.]
MRRQQAVYLQPPDDGAALKLALTPNEAAERLSMGRTLLDALLADGSIKSVRIGHRKVIIPITELQAFLERSLAKGSASA